MANKTPIELTNCVLMLNGERTYTASVQVTNGKPKEEVWFNLIAANKNGEPVNAGKLARTNAEGFAAATFATIKSWNLVDCPVLVVARAQQGVAGPTTVVRQAFQLRADGVVS